MNLADMYIGGKGMLVLFRWAGESIYIGDDIKVKVNEVGPGWARIAIEAPKSVAIVREELLKVTKEEEKTDEKSENPHKKILK